MNRPLLAALALSLACARAPEPAPEYAEARRRHAALAARADAATSPEMDEVLALLARVPAASGDAAAAAELRGRIEAERKAAGEERARRAAAVERAATPPSFPAGALAPAPPPPAPNAPPALQLEPGAKLAELEAQAKGCFARKGEVEIVQGERKRAGEAWELAADPACGERFAAQQGQWLLFADGAFVGTTQAASARVITTTRTVPAPAPGSPRAPAGGAK